MMMANQDSTREIRLATLWIAVHRINSINRAKGAAKTRRAVARLVSDQSLAVRDYFSKSPRRAMRACIHGCKLAFPVSGLIALAAYGDRRKPC